MSENTVPCTRCAQVEVPAPQSIEDDPLCPACLKALVEQAADAAFVKTQEARRENPHSIVHPDNAAAFEETVGQICRRMSGAEEYDEVDPSLTPAGYAPDGLGAPRDEIEEPTIARVGGTSRRPIIKCRGCGEKFSGRLRDRHCPSCQRG